MAGKARRLGNQQKWSLYTKDGVINVRLLWSYLCALFLWLWYYISYLRYLNPGRYVTIRRSAYVITSNGEIHYKPSYGERLADFFRTDASKKRKLLTWLQAVLPNFRIFNFTTCWQDGIALCALIEEICPGACPRHDLLKPHEKVNNCRLGLRLAKKHLGIPQCVAPEEIARGKDSAEPKMRQLLSLVKYLATENHQKPLGERIKYVTRDSSIDRVIGHCTARGSGLKVGIVGKRSKFTISITSDELMDLLIEIRGPRGEFCSEMIRGVVPNRSMGKILEWDKSADEVPEEPSLSRGKWNAAQRIVRQRSFEGEQKDAPKIPFDYQLISEGKFIVYYIPRSVGQHTLNIKWQGRDVNGSPFDVLVTKKAKSVGWGKENLSTGESTSDEANGVGPEDAEEIFVQPRPRTPWGRKVLGQIQSRGFENVGQGRPFGQGHHLGQGLASGQGPFGHGEGQLVKQGTVTRRRVLKRVITKAGKEVVIQEADGQERGSREENTARRIEPLRTRSSSLSHLGLFETVARQMYQDHVKKKSVDESEGKDPGGEVRKVDLVKDFEEAQKGSSKEGSAGDKGNCSLKGSDLADVAENDKGMENLGKGTERTEKLKEKSRPPKESSNEGVLRKNENSKRNIFGNDGHSNSEQFGNNGNSNREQFGNNGNSNREQFGNSGNSKKDNEKPKREPLGNADFGERSGQNEKKTFGARDHENTNKSGSSECAAASLEIHPRTPSIEKVANDLGDKILESAIADSSRGVRLRSQQGQQLNNAHYFRPVSEDSLESMPPSPTSIGRQSPRFGDRGRFSTVSLDSGLSAYAGRTTNFLTVPAVNRRTTFERRLSPAMSLLAVPERPEVSSKVAEVTSENTKAATGVDSNEQQGKAGIQSHQAGNDKIVEVDIVDTPAKDETFGVKSDFKATPFDNKKNSHSEHVKMTKSDHSDISKGNTGRFENLFGLNSSESGVVHGEREPDKRADSEEEFLSFSDEDRSRKGRKSPFHKSNSVGEASDAKLDNFVTLKVLKSNSMRKTCCFNAQKGFSGSLSVGGDRADEGNSWKRPEGAASKAGGEANSWKDPDIATSSGKDATTDEENSSEEIRKRPLRATSSLPLMRSKRIEIDSDDTDSSTQDDEPPPSGRSRRLQKRNTLSGADLRVELESLSSLQLEDILTHFKTTDFNESLTSASALGTPVDVDTEIDDVVGTSQEQRIGEVQIGEADSEDKETQCSAHDIKSETGWQAGARYIKTRKRVCKIEPKQFEESKPNAENSRLHPNRALLGSDDEAKVDHERQMTRQSTLETGDSGIADDFNLVPLRARNGEKLVNGHRAICRKPYRGRIDLDPALTSDKVGEKKPARLSLGKIAVSRSGRSLSPKRRQDSFESASSDVSSGRRVRKKSGLVKKKIAFSRRLAYHYYNRSSSGSRSSLGSFRRSVSRDTFREQRRRFREVVTSAVKEAAGKLDVHDESAKTTVDAEISHPNTNEQNKKIRCECSKYLQNPKLYFPYFGKLFQSELCPGCRHFAEFRNFAEWAESAESGRNRGTACSGSDEDQDDISVNSNSQYGNTIRNDSDDDDNAFERFVEDMGLSNTYLQPETRVLSPSSRESDQRSTINHTSNATDLKTGDFGNSEKQRTAHVAPLNSEIRGGLPAQLEEMCAEVKKVRKDLKAFSYTPDTLSPRSSGSQGKHFDVFQRIGLDSLVAELERSGSGRTGFNGVDRVKDSVERAENYHPNTLIDNVEFYKMVLNEQSELKQPAKDWKTPRANPIGVAINEFKTSNETRSAQSELPGGSLSVDESYRGFGVDQNARSSLLGELNAFGGLSSSPLKRAEKLDNVPTKGGADTKLEHLFMRSTKRLEKLLSRSSNDPNREPRARFQTMSDSENAHPFVNERDLKQKMGRHFAGNDGHIAPVSSPLGRQVYFGVRPVESLEYSGIPNVKFSLKNESANSEGLSNFQTQKTPASDGGSSFDLNEKVHVRFNTPGPKNPPTISKAFQNGVSRDRSNRNLDPPQGHLSTSSFDLTESVHVRFGGRGPRPERGLGRHVGNSRANRLSDALFSDGSFGISQSTQDTLNSFDEFLNGFLNENEENGVLNNFADRWRCDEDDEVFEQNEDKPGADLPSAPDPKRCVAFGPCLNFGRVYAKNNFQVRTEHAGNGTLTVCVKGPRPHNVIETSVNYTGDDLYEVTFEVNHPGYYIIAVRWADINIPNSPFICKVTY